MKEWWVTIKTIEICSDKVEALSREEARNIARNPPKGKFETCREEIKITVEPRPKYKVRIY